MAQMHGKFNFGNLANFAGQFVEMKLQEMGAAGDNPNEPPRAQQHFQRGQPVFYIVTQGKHVQGLPPIS